MSYIKKPAECFIDCFVDLKWNLFRAKSTQIERAGDWIQMVRVRIVLVFQPYYLHVASIVVCFTCWFLGMLLLLLLLLIARCLSQSLPSIACYSSPLLALSLGVVGRDVFARECVCMCVMPLLRAFNAHACFCSLAAIAALYRSLTFHHLICCFTIFFSICGVCFASLYLLFAYTQTQTHRIYRCWCVACVFNLFSFQLQCVFELATLFTDDTSEVFLCVCVCVCYLLSPWFHCLPLIIVHIC